MCVFVKNQRGESLMPCSNRKARILLKENKAKIMDYKPFTIQLLYATGETTQDIHVGVDLGTKHIGLAITSQDTVLVKGEIELRQDIKSNLEARKIYRRSRRNRKTRYRKARFLNRTSSKKEGWLPPSIQSRIANTFRWIDRFCSLVPNPILHIEVGKFDVQKMMNPNIQGKEYQEGEAFGYHEVRYFVFARDNYSCQVCKKKNKILQTHHILYRSKGGTDRASNLITVCTDCHTYENHQEGQIFWKWVKEKTKTPQFKEAPFMNTVRKRVFKKYPTAHITYGSVTTLKRKELDLEKTHYNDALAISGIDVIKKDSNGLFKIVQFRKKKRSLHEATARKGRKIKNVTSKRNEKNTKQLKGFSLNDKARVFGKVGFITGFTGTSGAYVKTIDGKYLTIPNKSYKQVNLGLLEGICRNNNWQFVQNSWPTPTERS
ncbi:RNA-guided endonuclease IscB [Peribacillus asahii]|uniref:RNA-guided endonuclease IscB n=1 Tax=Peribacillus asahii TaxID=228899 RepID=UPI0037F1C3C9